MGWHFLQETMETLTTPEQKLLNVLERLDSHQYHFIWFNQVFTVQFFFLARKVIILNEAHFFSHHVFEAKSAPASSQGLIICKRDFHIHEALALRILQGEPHFLFSSFLERFQYPFLKLLSLT